MDADKIEKTIIINNKETIVMIDKTMSVDKSKKIVDDFCKYFNQMKSSIKAIKNYKPSDFDYIVVMLIVKNCTDFLDQKMENFVDVTLKYSELVTKNIIQQIFKGMSDSDLSKSIDKVIVSCRIVSQNELSINKLEGLIAPMSEEVKNINIIKINKDTFDFDKSKLEKMFFKKKKEKEQEKKQHEVSFDDLLDAYADAKLLYEMFSDDEYLKKMKLILSKMKRRWKKSYGDKNSP
jgi:hypothetical protein